MSKKSNTNEFILKSNKIHSNFYTYLNTEYVNAKTKIIITCPSHGNFEQVANNHLNGQGCPKCKTNVIKSTLEKFMSKANKIHNIKYDYNLVNYKNSRTKVKIICKEHGIFEQTPNNHLSGKGCPKCGAKNIKKYQQENSTGWTYSAWKKAGENSKKFDSFKVYIIKCWNENEEFYKIGKTYHSVGRRFGSKAHMPYNYEIVNVYENEAKEISLLEKQLQKENKKFKYTPKFHFDGINECYSKINKNGL